MCDPITAFALASTAVGAVAHNRAAQQVQDARNSVQQTEMQRQAMLQQQADAATNNTINGFQSQNQSQQREQSADQREQAYQPVTAPGLASIPSTPDAPSAIKGEIAQAVGDQVKRGQSDAHALSQLASYGDQNMNNNLSLAGNAQKLGMLGNFSQGSQAVVPYELMGANNAGKNMQSWGDIASTVGQLAGMYSFAQPMAVGHGLAAAPVYSDVTGALEQPAIYSGSMGGIGSRIASMFKRPAAQVN